MEQKFNFFCQDHPSEQITRVDPSQHSERDLYCTECIFNATDTQSLSKRVQKLEVFLKELAELFAQNKPKIIEKNQTPSELSILLEKRSEYLSMMTQNIELEKGKVQKVFDMISTATQEIITKKREEYLKNLDNQLVNFIHRFSSLESQILKAYPTSDSLNQLYPSLEQLTQRLQDTKGPSDLLTVIKDLKGDAFELKHPNRENFIQSSIKMLTRMVDESFKSPPVFAEIKPEETVKALEKLISDCLQKYLRFENPIKGPLASGPGQDNSNCKVTVLDPSKMSVEVSYCCQGGGTGREFAKNLLIPGDAGWNKWYGATSGKQWIIVKIGKPKYIRCYGLKSANDCDNRDPCSWDVYGKTLDGNWELIDQKTNVLFDSRYQFKYFPINPYFEMTEIKIDINENRSLREKGHWGDGTQLAEVSLFE